MKTSTRIVLCMLCFLGVLPARAGWFSSTVAEYRWEVETSRPQSQEIPLYRRETVDLICRVINYGAPMNLSNAVVVLHAATNGQPANTSYQITGFVGLARSPANATNGYLTVRVDVDRYLPVASAMSWVIEATDTNGVLARLRGTFKITGSVASSYIAPSASLLADPAGSAQAVSNALAAALQAETTRAQQAESDAAATAIAAAGTQSAGMLLTGTAFRATSADRIVQLDTHAWVTVSAGTALLWRVTSDTNTLVVTSSSVGSWGFVPAIGSAFRRVSGTLLFTNICADGVWSITNSYMWSPEPWGASGGNPEGYYNAPFGKYQVTVAYAPLTNAYPLARLDDLPSLAPYATATQLAAVSNLALQASAAAAVAATNAVDPVARASAASKPSYANVTNIATSIVAGYAAPSFPVYDYGLRTNVTFVLSNSVLYLYGQ